VQPAELVPVTLAGALNWFTLGTIHAHRLCAPLAFGCTDGDDEA
jgi:hypothetical protein